MQTKYGLRSALFAGIIGIGASLALSGCGGTSSNSKTYANDQAAGPAIYGVSASLANPSLSPVPDYLEVSGLANANNTEAAIVGVGLNGFKTIKGTPPLSIDLFQANPGGVKSLPEGFPSGGQYIDESLATSLGAATPGQAYQFRVNISNGQSTSGEVIPIVPASVVLTSTDPEWHLGTLPLTFDTNYAYTGPLANCPYGTAPFNLPFTTSGLHAVTVTCADTSGNETSTTFQILVLAPGSSALFAQAIETVAPVYKNGKLQSPAVCGTRISPGDKVVLTSADGKTVLQTVASADPDGTAIFIAPPGSYGVVDVTVGKGGANIVPAVLTANTVTDQYNDAFESSNGVVTLPEPPPS